jgi:hypothetical protein
MRMISDCLRSNCDMNDVRMLWFILQLIYKLNLMTLKKRFHSLEYKLIDVDVDELLSLLVSMIVNESDHWSFLSILDAFVSSWMWCIFFRNDQTYNDLFEFFFSVIKITILKKKNSWYTSHLHSHSRRWIFYYRTSYYVMFFLCIRGKNWFSSLIYLKWWLRSSVHFLHL